MNVTSLVCTLFTQFIQDHAPAAKVHWVENREAFDAAHASLRDLGFRQEKTDLYRTESYLILDCAVLRSTDEIVVIAMARPQERCGLATL